MTSMTGGTLLGVVYGINIETDKGSSYFQMMEKAVETGTFLTNSGAFLGALLPLFYILLRLIQSSGLCPDM